MPGMKTIDDANNPGFEAIPDGEFATEEMRKAPWWVRLALMGIAVGLMAVFIVGAMLHPYEADGAPKTHGTHRQLGLPPCSFYSATGMPCPSCGFTTAFSLVAHADLGSAFRVNSVGALLAMYCFMLIPWSLVSLWRRRVWLVRSIEKVAIVSVSVFVPLMIIRWLVLLVSLRWSGQS